MPTARILVADDSKEVVAFLKNYLELQDYEVQTAYDGETAVRLFEVAVKAAAEATVEPFDVVLIDMRMPRLDGLGVLQRVKKQAPDVPVIILTGAGTLENALEAMRQGAFDYLLKPAENNDQIELALHRALQHRRLLLENRQLVEDLKAVKTHLEQKVAEQTYALRRAYEQFQQGRQSQLATGLLHQISNAVANIPELVDELYAMRLPEAAQTLLNELRLSAIATAQIRNWLHQFVRIGNLSPTWVDLVELAREKRQQLDDEKRRPPQVRVSKVIVNGSIPLILADRTLLGILIENLLQNAYEAILPTRAGGVGIWIGVDGEYCTMHFRDNGAGIPLEDQRAIWEWGWSTKPDSRNTKGRGLGLYASRQIALAHEGTLDLVNSSFADGTTFLVRLPVAGPRKLSEE